MAAFSKLTKNITPLHASGVVVSASAVWLAVRYMRSLNDRIKRKDELNIVIGAEKQQKKNKAAVDAVFFRRLVRIIKIMIPGWFSPEMWYILVVAISLGTRTYCDLWMIENYTSIESAIIGRNLQLFKKYLFKFLCAMPAISVVNSMLKYSLNELQLRFRARLTNHLYSKYLRSFTYYKMSNLDNRISNADQLLTQDVEKFCNSVTELYSNLSKPLVDITLYTAKLTSAIGISGPLYMLLYLGMSGMVLTRLRRPMGRMTVTEQRLEGEFRYVNSRLITNSEEIAFYKGNVKEQGTITATFGRLIDHVRKLIFFKFNMALIDNALAKYFATVVGYLIVCRPFLNLAHPRHLNSTHSEILEDYYTSGRMLVRMSEAIGRIVLAGREMTRLSGYTARVTEFMSVLDEVNQGKYERTMISQRTESTDKLPALTAGALNLHPGNGTVINKDHIIKFEHVPLVTPNGDVLVEDLNFEVRSGVNVLVCGPNGCGKSSLFRILGELWPLFGGTLTKPESGQLFYVPQRPYMTIGSLRDQVIYPDTHDMQIKKGVTDDDLDKIMEQVQLSYISDREHGWNAVQDWMDVLSGGEKQRIAMARLFYHKPQFAILDECTSAVSVDVEGFIYQRCKEIGITLFTVSHRKSLWVHHQYYLHMDGRGSFEFKPITGDTVEFGS